MSQPWQVLIIEDSTDDALLTVRQLERSDLTFEWEHVESAAALQSALAARTWDAVISDYNMGRFGAPEALELVRERQPDVPFIVVSGTIGEQVAVEMMKSGAQDYVMKGNLTRLPQAVRREIQEAQIRTERRRVEAVIQREHAFREQILENMAEGLCVFYETAAFPFLHFTQWNRRMESITGYTRVEINRLGWYHSLYSDPEMQQQAVGSMQRALAGDNRVAEEWQICRRDGVQRLVTISTSAIADPTGRASVLAILQDVTERRQAEMVVRSQLKAIEASIEGIAILKDGQLTYVNLAYGQLFGYERAEEILGQPFLHSYDVVEKERFEREIFPLLQRERVWRGEVVAIRQDGSTFTESLSLTLTNEDLTICVCRDTINIKQVQAMVARDPLTGLPNRTVLLEHLRTVVRDAKQQGSYNYAVLLLDLDGLKFINDSFGRSNGDWVLTEIARQLEKCIRDRGIVARLEEDEFAILLKEIEDRHEVIQIVEQILADRKMPLTLDERMLFVSLGVGIVMDSIGQIRVEDLIFHADTAMRQAKKEKRNSYKFFSGAAV